MEAKEYISKLRSMGLSQQDIADRCGMQQSAVSKIESGAVQDVLSRSYRAIQALYDEVLRIDRKSKRNKARAKG